MNEPTHVIYFSDNNCGDHDKCYVMAYLKDGVFYEFDSGKELVQYEGDEILEVYLLTDIDDENQNHLESDKFNEIKNRIDNLGPDEFFQLLDNWIEWKEQIHVNPDLTEKGLHFRRLKVACAMLISKDEYFYGKKR